MTLTVEQGILLGAVCFILGYLVSVFQVALWYKNVQKGRRPEMPPELRTPPPPPPEPPPKKYP